jgi:hypothetical protein
MYLRCTLPVYDTVRYHHVHVVAAGKKGSHALKVALYQSPLLDTYSRIMQLDARSL